jgi:hypothetical protein
MKMFTILVPTVRNNGRPFRLRYHRLWDAKVRDISGGLTIMPPVKGQWMHGSELFAERMIPVMFIATDAQKDAIVAMTLIHYEQLAMLCWEVSQNVTLYHPKP